MDTDLVFAAPDIAFVRAFVVAVILVLTAANAFAPFAAGGGHTYKLCLYGAVVTFLSGAAMLVIPLIVRGIFASVTSPM